MNFMTFHSVENFIIPTDEFTFFRGVESTNQIIYGGFPEMGVPPNHPFHRVFHCKPNIFGDPIYGTPHIYNYIECMICMYNIYVYMYIYVIYIYNTYIYNTYIYIHVSCSQEVDVSGFAPLMPFLTLKFKGE